MKKLRKNELKEMLNYNKEKEYWVSLPNNLFQILLEDKELMKKRAPHIAYAYTYVYYITWLYRYAKYGVMDLESLTDKKIKRVLGISEITKDYNYITKRNGVLERLGIIQTKSFAEAPVQWHWNDTYNLIEGFTTYEEELNGMHPEDIEQLKAFGAIRNVKRREFKYPVFALEDRVINETTYLGTFYNKEYTHMIDFDVFIECMSNPELGCTAFYLYGLLKMYCGNDNGTCNPAVETISNKTGIKPTTRDKALKALRAFRIIGCKVEPYVIERGDHKTESNTYWCYEKESEFSSARLEIVTRSVIHGSHLDKQEELRLSYKSYWDTVIIDS